MYSLNDIIKACAGNFPPKPEWVLDEDYGWDVEFDLSDELPGIYPTEDISALFNALNNLIGEIIKHCMVSYTKNKARVKTIIEGNIQILELAWNGDKLSEDEIEMINAAYQEGSGLSYEPSFSATRIAGYCLNKFGGKIRIENFEDGIYSVRNRVELPVDYSSFSGKTKI